MVRLRSEADETSETIVDFLCSAISAYDLGGKIVAYCADNAMVNFGGINRNGQKNVFYKMRNGINKHNVKACKHLIGLFF